MGLKEDKVSLRKEMRRRKKCLSSSEMLAAEISVLEGLLKLDKFRDAKSVAAYWSLPDEFPTHEIISRLVEMGKEVYLPVIIAPGVMEFRRFLGPEELTPDEKYGIPEPQSGEVLADEDCVVLVPGMAFASDGSRLGRGGGFYDRALAKMLGAFKIGVAFACQQYEDIPMEPSDARVDVVLFG